MEKPVKPSFSVRMENTLNYHSVCQNKTDLHLTQCLPTALRFSLRNIWEIGIPVLNRSIMFKLCLSINAARLSANLQWQLARL
jgi:hypothetical protein